MKDWVIASTLENENWRKLYDISDTKCFPGTDVVATEGGYYIFDDCGELTSVTKEEYDDFSNGNKHIAYRLTEQQTHTVYSELTSLLRELSNRNPAYVFTIIPGVIKDDSDKYTWLHSFRVEKIMTIDEFVHTFSNTMLEEYDKFVERSGGPSNTLARDYFLNHYYFPMKKKKKDLLKKVVELKPANVDLDHITEIGMEELEAICKSYDDDWI